MFDCNFNGIEDAVDIGLGTSLDCNQNGVPDGCELQQQAYCFGVGCLSATTTRARAVPTRTEGAR